MTARDSLIADGESVTCGYAGCTKTLRRSDFGGPQFCSKNHRDGVPFGSRDVALCRERAEEALREYAEALRFWNAPDDEHTRIQIRRLAEGAIEEAFADV